VEAAVERVPDPAASLAAELGVGAFCRAFERWASSADPASSASSADSADSADPAGRETLTDITRQAFGPALVAESRSTLQMIKAMLDGTMTVVPRQRFGVADVRDVADAHIRAMTVPAAAGQRFGVLADGPTISWLIMAQILRDRLGPLAARVPTVAAPGSEPPDLIIHNERAKRVLGSRPRAAATTIVETAESLRDLGLLEQP
jgi:hypothetical protein